MMISEFIERTGFEPTADEYAKIEEAYYNFDGDKGDFCRAFVAHNGASRICKARAEEISRLRSVILETEKQFKKDMAERDRRIEKLTADLDRELEWKPANAGTNMTQRDYEHLFLAGHTMTDEEAVAFIADECGFAPEKIRILHEANSYEVNKHKQLLKSKNRYKHLTATAGFDYLPATNRKHDPTVFYELPFRIVRFRIMDGLYETVVTNPDAQDFPASELKKLYNMRWGIETSFRELKYTVGLLHFHAKRWSTYTKRSLPDWSCTTLLSWLLRA